LKPCQTPSHTLVLSELSLCESTALCGHIDVVVAPNTFDFFYLVFSFKRTYAFSCDKEFVSFKRTYAFSCDKDFDIYGMQRPESDRVQFFVLAYQDPLFS
jgi:hypothetical protein